FSFHIQIQTPESASLWLKAKRLPKNLQNKPNKLQNVKATRPLLVPPITRNPAHVTSRLTPRLPKEVNRVRNSAVLRTKTPWKLNILLFLLPFLKIILNIPLRKILPSCRSITITSTNPLFLIPNQEILKQRLLFLLLLVLLPTK